MAVAQQEHSHVAFHHFRVRPEQTGHLELRHVEMLVCLNVLLLRQRKRPEGEHPDSSSDLASA